MRLQDFTRLIWRSINARRQRSLLSLTAIAIGITAVVLLTALGQGVENYITRQFSQFGTHLIAVSPGKTTTAGMSGAIIANERPLSLEQAQRLRRLPGITGVSGVVQGNARVEFGNRGRRTTILGVSHEADQVWQIAVVRGQFLPADDGASARAFAVLGQRMAQELFGHQSPLGEKIRIANESYRVIGTMVAKGQVLGFDLDDTVYIPTARALTLFNRESLMEIDLTYSPGFSESELVEQLRQQFIDWHGREDFTIMTQQDMLSALGDISSVVTAAVAAMGGISLLVGAIGIFTVMTIAVQERTAEIGLLQALGATRRQLRGLFVAEATTLAMLGGMAGTVAGVILAMLIAELSPIPAIISPTYLLAALLLALTVGIAAGSIPALRAARMLPVEALRAE